MGSERGIVASFFRRNVKAAATSIFNRSAAVTAISANTHRLLPEQQRRYIARSLLAAGRFDEAINAFRRIHEEHPNDQSRFGEYCQALARAGRMDDLKDAALAVDFAKIGRAHV